MVMSSRPAPPRPKRQAVEEKEESKVCLVNYGLMKHTAPGDPPFYALVQQHTATTLGGSHFWQGVAIDTAANRTRRFETPAGAMQEVNLFRAVGVRVDAIVRVNSTGQHLEHWVAAKEEPPQGADAGSW